MLDLRATDPLVELPSLILRYSRMAGVLADKRKSRGMRGMVSSVLGLVLVIFSAAPQARAFGVLRPQFRTGTYMAADKPPISNLARNTIDYKTVIAQVGLEVVTGWVHASLSSKSEAQGACACDRLREPPPLQPSRVVVS